MTPQEIANGPAVMKELQDIAYIGMQLEPGEILAVISQVQLALRHPENNGPSAQVAEKVIRQWIGLLPEPVQPYMLLGFDPAHDVERVCDGESG